MHLLHTDQLISHVSSKHEINTVSNNFYATQAKGYTVKLVNPRAVSVPNNYLRFQEHEQLLHKHNYTVGVILGECVCKRDAQLVFIPI